MFKIFGKSKTAGILKSKFPFTSAIILCAGSSERFGSNKQMATVCGQSVIEHTISVFEGLGAIKEIVLVVPKDLTQEYKDIVFQNGFAKVSCIVTGGETRQLSAFRGFKHISDKAKLVAIHDGARCLVTPQIIERVLAEANEYGAATAACKTVDTLKIADEEGFIDDTIDRNLVWQVQTPQIFDTELYAEASLTAKENGFAATDDCMLVESLGYKVKLVDTGRDNIKITHPDDILLAEFILNKRGVPSK